MGAQPATGRRPLPSLSSTNGRSAARSCSKATPGRCAMIAFVMTVLSPADLAAAVAARTPVDEREARSIERITRELARLDRPYDEHADPVHVTGTAIIT